MQIDAIERETLTADVLMKPVILDPLNNDEVDDEVVVTSRRGLVRLALVAAETASRFEREAIPHDPIAWMLFPRALFEGRSAIDACLAREACLRAVLLHGLSMDLDADPVELDALIENDGEEGGDDFDDFDGFDEPGDESPRLWTSFLVEERAGGTIHAFDAVVAGDHGEAERRLRARHGAVAQEMVIVEGFDPNLPLAEALVSPAVADMLAQVAADPCSPLGRGLSMHIEQRFAA